MSLDLYQKAILNELMNERTFLLHAPKFISEELNITDKFQNLVQPQSPKTPFTYSIYKVNPSLQTNRNCILNIIYSNFNTTT